MLNTNELIEKLIGIKDWHRSVLSMTDKEVISEACNELKRQANEIKRLEKSIHTIYSGNT